ncbi:hypothetical protein L0668_15175 [Paraglaciecola aquimarina]|uniref:Uncharacterized protein n=1 Tax=Paraglaciecola algarum TaxID=3050085 RepID=A0ABS9D938_9ALTE|nr:hypothetical protein [Paraglaciecola sp. G1-23]MCF2949460.1 hypothetical protein [Paraglaciecola sp. G1-23]
MKTTYADNGSLSIKINRLSDKQTIIDYQSDKIDMWRGSQKEHFVRPKWGLYRSLKTKEMLENKQDTIRFADFEVIKTGI